MDPVLISGFRPPPVRTNRDRGWDDPVVEHYRAGPMSFVIQPLAYTIRAHLSRAARVDQRRRGKNFAEILTDGMATIVRPGGPMAWRCESDTESVIVRLGPDFLGRLAAAAADADAAAREIVEQPAVVDPNVAQIAHGLRGELERETFASRIRCESLVTSLGVHLLRRYAAPLVAIRPDRGTLSQRNVRLALEFIDANLSEPLSLARIAGEVGMSTYHFARVFKQTVGVAPHQHVIQQRLDRAKRMLAHSKVPIAEIALAVGCANQSHFSALFHRATGTTPLAYRHLR